MESIPCSHTQCGEFSLVVSIEQCAGMTYPTGAAIHSGIDSSIQSVWKRMSGTELDLLGYYDMSTHCRVTPRHGNRFATHWKALVASCPQIQKRVCST